MIFSFSIIIIVSLGQVAAKSGIENNNNNNNNNENKVYSVELNAFGPEELCEFYREMNSSHSFCDPNLSEENVDLTNHDDMIYTMQIEIGSNHQTFQVYNCSNK